MTDENVTPSEENTEEAQQTEQFPTTSEESATIAASQTAADAQAIVVDDTTVLIGEPTIARETPASLAEQPTLSMPPAFPENSGREIADEQTLLMPQEAVGQAVPPTQAAVPPHLPTDASPTQVAPGAADYTQMAAYAQPAYAPSDMPLQPGQVDTSIAPKKRRTALWISLIILVVLLLGGGTALALIANQPPTNTPTQALQQFCDGYKTLNAQEIYSTLSKNSQDGTSLAQLQQALDQLKSLSSFAKFSDCAVSNVKQNGSTATGTITLTVTVSFGGFSSASSIPMTMGLVLENNTWKVDTTKTKDNFTMPAVPTFPPNFLTPTVAGSTNQ